MDANVKVFCRVRPPNERERGVAGSTLSGSAGYFARRSDAAFTKACVTVPNSDASQQTLFLHGKHGPARTFTFDRVFGQQASQTDVFQAVGAPITRACLEGYNGTIFAYGQTGSGKTFTMQGPDDVIDADSMGLTQEQLDLRGLVPRVFDFLFENVVEKDKDAKVQHVFKCSFLEIYNERVYDLLDGGSTKDPTGLQLRENGRKGVHVEGLIESVVTSSKKAAELMTLGAQNRRVGQTSMNRESSRSHSVFILQLQTRETSAEGTKIRTSRFNLVDLAGSERQRSTDAAGERLKEAGSINKSLSALGNVIMGLSEQSVGKHRHVHYRDSKLTFLLKDSLGGNSKTFMIATISPAEDSAFETLSTLKFAQRAKMIQNSAVINEDSIGSTSFLQEEIVRLRQQLQQAHQEIARNIPGSSLLQEGAALSQDSESCSSTRQLGAQCDPAVDGRFRELEESLATTAEKNDRLIRSNEYLQLQNGNFQALCDELKQHISKLKMTLRLRGIGGSGVYEYEPSTDAIEWRMRYEEMEERFAELQDELERSGAMDDSGALTGKVNSEVENLNMMLLGLSKQLAFVLRDKHDLQDRLLEHQSDKHDSSSQRTQESVDAEFSTRLEEALKQQAIEYQAQLDSLTVSNACVEEKAAEISLELLQIKQREESWTILLHDLERQLADAKHALQSSEEAQSSTYEKMVQEKLRVEELTLQLERAREVIRLEFESTLADTAAAKRDLEIANDLSRNQLAEVTGSLEQIQRQLQESENACAQLVGEKKQMEAEQRNTASQLDQAHAELKEAATAAATMKLEIADRDSVIESLKRAEAALTHDNSALQTKLEDMNESIQQLKQDAEASARSHADDISKLRREAGDEVTRLTEDFEKQLAVKDEQLQQLCATLDDQKAKAVEDTQRYSESLEAKEAALVNLQRQLDEHKTESKLALENLKQKLADSSDALSKLTNAKAGVEASHASALTEIEGLKTDAEKLKLEKQAMMDEIQSLSDRVRQLTVRSSELHEQNTALGSKCEDQATQLADAEGKVKKLTQEVETLQQQVSTQSSEAADLRKHLEDSQEAGRVAAAAHAEEMSLRSKTIDEMTRKLTERTDELAATSTKLNKAESEIRDAEETASHQREEIEMYKGIQTSLRDEVRKLEFDRLELAESLKTEQESKQDVELKFSKAKELWESEKNRLTQETKRSVEALQSRIEELTASSDALSAQKNSLEQDNEDLQKSVAALEASLQELKKTIAERDDKICALESTSADSAATQDELTGTVAELRGSLRDLERKLDDQQRLTSRQEVELTEKLATISARDDSIRLLQERLETDEAARELKAREYKAELEAAHGRVQAFEQLIAEKTAVFAKAEEDFLSEKQSLEQKLEEAEDVAAQHAEQLTREISQLEAAVKQKDGQLQAANSLVAELEARVKRATEEANKSKLEELQQMINELEAKHKAALAENAELKQNSEFTSTLREQEKQLTHRREEIEAAKKQVALDQIAVAADKTVAEMEAKTKSAAQEALAQTKRQFMKEKVKLQRDLQTLNKRVETLTRENEKLVGHHNARQKIQHHVKVKEENNRLLDQVRRLTDEKFQLMRALEKYEPGRKEKEKENLDVESTAGTPSVSPASNTSTTKKVRTSLGSASASTASSTARVAARLAKRPSLTTSTGTTRDPSRAAKAARLAALARPRSTSTEPSRKRMRTPSSSSSGWQR